ncbi:hypothetical protein B0T16DRAFT_355478 [Cercophora newfieldiana]|uniref:E3 ubiquitin-protein ligase listerin n=1 Tax=Cercophora newfieldiana TaxID=92897 RepID=A0AA39Y0L7_9PEZI|nr:hypothetical protein B0T16DRAFT_355478 [Cercophora newfieldiana]
MKRATKFGNSPGTSSPGGFGSPGNFGSPGGFGAFSSSTTLSYITPPPDLSSIPQEIVVPFKNLLKKDSITKAKALDELLSYVKGHDGELEEPILDAWAQLYARISIDNSRTVRESSHTLLVMLLKSARKRMEKRIPSMVGPWLAGTFDKDRVVSRAATSGLTFLDTKEKEAKFWARCQAQILKFATEAVLETPDTLSDERSSTKEDSLAKYYRVIGGSLSLVLNLIARVDMSVIEDGLARYLEVEAIWGMASAGDGFVRKTLFQLLQAVLDKRPDLLKPRLSQIGKILVADSLKSAQTGSAADLVKALTKLTQSFPQVWGTKTHPLQRLRPFVEKGSQGSSPTYWQDLDLLFEALSATTVSTEIATSFLKSLRIGISNRLEPRANAHQAWGTYMSSFGRLLKATALDASFVEDNFYPLAHQYLHPSQDQQVWASPAPITLSPKFWRILASHPTPEIRASVEKEWQKLRDAFLLRMTNSLPEVSQDYQKSQQLVAGEGQRWFGLAGAILRELDQDTTKSAEDLALQSTITESSVAVLRGALDLLVRRNYKPFGAASVIQAAFEKCPKLCSEDRFVAALFPIQDPDKLKLIVASPSLPNLIQSLDSLSGTRQEIFSRVWTALVDTALLSTPEIAVTAANALIRLPSAAPLAQAHEGLREFLASNWLQCAGKDDSSSSWELCESTLSFSAVTDGSLTTIIADIVQKLDVSEDSGSALRALKLITDEKPALVSQHRTAHVDLVTKLLALTELQDKEISGEAAALQTHLDQKVTGQSPLVKIIQNNLEDAGPTSLGLDVLIQRAITTFKSGSVPIEELFPSSNTWLNELTPFLQTAPNPSLSLTSSMGGAYFLAKGSEAKRRNTRRDAKGRSIPARMAIYTSALLTSGLSISSLPEAFHLELTFLLSLTGELAADQLTTMEKGGLWEAVEDGEDATTEMQDLVTLGQKIINDIAAEATNWRDSSFSGNTVAERLTNFALQHTQDLSTASLYSAKVLSSLLQALVETHGAPTRLDEWLGKLGIMKLAPRGAIFSTIAFLVGLGETLSSSETVKTLCNRLASEMIGAMPGVERTLHSIVLLNICLSVYEAGEAPVDARKQTLALKQMTSWMDTPDEMSSSLASEACKGVLRVLPTVKGVYGPYWEQAINYCILLWTDRAAKEPSRTRLPYVYASLKLIAALMGATDDDDASDDLAEAVAQSSQDISKGLIELLKVHSEVSQSSQIVESLLCRMLERVPLSHIGDLSDLYGLVAADSREVQTAAFGLLHRALPAAQEKLSVDLLLEKKNASLPDELLSLLLDAPTLEMYPEEVLVQFPPPVRSYLLAWHLIFDTYSKAPFKLQNDYSESLKKQNFVEPLLNFMFDVLGHSAGHPLNPDKEGFTRDFIRSYDMKIANSESDERNMHWLLIHLLFLTLKHIPGLFRMWFLDCRSKQTKVALEPWLVRYFSPLIISDVLDEVVKWAEKQEVTDDDEKELVVKVSRAAHEVTAGYEVDEEVAAIVIRIPSAFPLATCEVASAKRVAVSEEKWKNWLMSTQGVIRFGNGGVIDGLTAFRRNIVGSLKGQTECAICYSIVSSDKMLPDKECGTCHHFYHRICLYKWFQNSGRNSCPLCRNPIEYLGMDSKRNWKT